MKLTKEEKIMQEYRDERSIELFDKVEALLGLGEVQKLDQYIYDLAHPMWRDVTLPWASERYEVSNTGNIRNKMSEYTLKPKQNRCGYKYVNLSVDGFVKSVTIHKLVAIAFIPNPENKPQVNHINGKKIINWVGNLEWNTPKENTDHAISTGLAGSKGVTNNNNKYSISQIHQVCKLLESGLTDSQISRITGVPAHVANKIKSGKQWIDISSEYNIPKPVNNKRPADLKLAIEELIFAGYSNREIVQFVGLPDTKFELEYIGLFRRRLLK